MIQGWSEPELVQALPNSLDLPGPSSLNQSLRSLDSGILAPLKRLGVQTPLLDSEMGLGQYRKKKGWFLLTPIYNPVTCYSGDEKTKQAKLLTFPRPSVGHKHQGPGKPQETTRGFLQEGLNLTHVLGNSVEAPWVSLASSPTSCKILLL